MLCLILFSGVVHAQEYEYRVVMIEKMRSTKVIPGVEGAFDIPNKTSALNNIMALGWELISVVPGDLSTERLYLRRLKK
tara:strand:- start:5464 stop:5700 length:237 start_codon:yes stop_codon:yes gene_type:complete